MAYKYKEIFRMVEEDDFLVNSNISNNKWFFDQLKSFLNADDYENFVSKNIKLENFSKNSLFLARHMMFKSTESKYTYDCLGFYTSIIHALIGLYSKFGKSLYDYKRDFLIRDIALLTKDIREDQMEDTIQKLPSFFAYLSVMLIYRKDENKSGLPTYMGIDGYFQFIIEDEKEGLKALENGWRNFKLWKLYRRLEKQGKLPIYKDKEVEKNLWYSKARSAWFLGDLDKIETITPMDETIAKNIATGIGRNSSVLLAFHVLGVFEAATRFCVCDDLRGKVPKKVLSELFRKGISLDEYVKNEIGAITRDYYTPSWWDLKFYRIPIVWEEWILVEWLFQKLKTSFKAMIKPRVYYMHGIKAEYTYFSRLDEIRPEDLTSGIKTSPSVAFKNSEARLRKIRMEQNVELPIAPFKDTETVQQLKCSFDFIEEGKFMHNCVAGYINSAKEKRCFIYHIESNNQHGTMEIDKYGAVLQLYGPYNDEPSPDVIYAVDEWLKVNNLEASEVIKDWRKDIIKE